MKVGELKRWLSAQGVTFEDFVETEMLRSAVARKLSIIGEALSQLLGIAPEFKGRIALARTFIELGDALLYRYRENFDATVWNALKTELPELLQEVNTLLSEEQPSPSESKV